MESAWAARERAEIWKTVGQLAGDLVHIRDHQQQTLRRGKGGGKRAGLQGAVHRASRAAFGLHLSHGGDGPPQVRDALRHH